MLLQLKYNEKQLWPVNAAIIPGSTPAEWLPQIGRWQVEPHDLQCFVLPESIRSTKAAGLFVIFKRRLPVSTSSLRYPYTQLAEGFFIPVNATLFPDVTPDELKKLKLWDIQVFHPAIGLIGYELKDALQLADLINLPEEKESVWLRELPQLEACQQLRSIRLEPEEQPVDAMDALSALINKQELNAIPKVAEEQKTFMEKILGALGIALLWFLLAFAFIGKLIFGVIGLFFSRGGRQASSADTKTSLLQQLENWVNDRLKDIEKQRDSELNRLLKLFDKNNDEALQYAIPLNSPYLNRGTAPKSGKLSRRTLNLNLRNFGRGGRADTWDLGAYRNTLRLKYMDSINKAIEKGDHKKAAYIYAHLLGEIATAAKTLQDGKHYREAAAIYKEHLNNRAKAAECLESGGLLSDAIPIYVDLGSYEKAGDLHTQLGQMAEARKYYQDTVDRSLAAKDYLNAARLSIDKMKEREIGRSILLDGWKGDNQPERCLGRYFEMAAQDEHPLDNEIKNVYKHHVAFKKKTAFLDVLADLAARKNDEQTRETAINISYQVVHEQVERGDHSGLRLLGKFHPGDRLLNQDSNRYILQNHERPKTLPVSFYLELRKDTQWFWMATYHDQLLAVGVKKEEVYLLRANWEGKINYEFLFLIKGGQGNMQLIADGYLTPAVILLGTLIPVQLKKRLEAFSYFEREVLFHEINWVSKEVFAHGLKANPEEMFILNFSDVYLCLDKFSLKGYLLERIECSFQGEKVNLLDMPYLQYSEMYWRKEHFYLSAADRIMRIAVNGELEMLPLETGTIAFSISSPYAALKLAVITQKGCLIITPSLKKMTVTTDFFAVEAGAQFIQLLPDNRLVIATEELAWVYDISVAQPKLINQVKPENQILKILMVPKRNHFALLESDNRISVHHLEDK